MLPVRHTWTKRRASHLPRATDVETYDDHRMAMSFAITGLVAPGIRIRNPSCVTKTFPHFFAVLERLREQ